MSGSIPKARLGWFTAFACGWAVVVAVVVWLGWALGFPLMKGVIPDAVAMNPVTALCFLLLGIALWLRRRPLEGRDTDFRRVAGSRVLAGAVILFGLARLGDYLLGWNLGWDRFLFPERLDAETAFPNRMAPNTAVLLILLACALLLIDLRRAGTNWAMPLLTLLVGMLAWVAIVGYAFSAEDMYGMGAFIPMALPTAVTFLVMASGILCSRPQAGFMEALAETGPVGTLARQLLCVMVLLPPLLGGLAVLVNEAPYLGTGAAITIVAVLNMFALGFIAWQSTVNLKRADEKRRRVEDDLRRAREEADAANRAKSQFLANMSHELRTPLNSIIGFSEILADKTFGELNERQEKYVDNVLGSGRHLLGLINDILDLSKIEAGGTRLDREHLDVEKLVRSAENIVSSLAAKKGIALSASVAEGLPRVYADSSKIKQVLYNLLSNAIKFTPEGGAVSVDVGIVNREENEPGETTLPGLPAELAANLAPGRYLLVAVRDSGIGVPPEDQARLFNEFEQLDSTYAREQEGTGLGLALTRRLVELHGGVIWVESQGIEGKGSVFRFAIPFRDDSTPEPAPPNRSDRPLVLVIEDDHYANGLLDQYLTEAGYAVAHAYSGAQGQEMAARYNPVAITLDILLPDQSGWDVLSALKGDSATCDIPVVVITITEDRDLGFSLGAVEYFVKPVVKEHLIGAIEKAASRQEKAVRNVLVVDDEPPAVEMIEAMLKEAGLEVWSAFGGREAINLAREQRPDLVVLDLLMPEINGFEVVRQLRADPLTREIPILVHTSKTLTADEERELRMQVQAVTQKGGTRQFLEELQRLTGHDAAPSGKGIA